MAYLEEIKTGRQQYRARNRKVLPVIVVHTAENMVDVRPPDNGAENVGRFIGRRTDAAGSYHTVIDSDGAYPLVSYRNAAYHCRRYNHTLGISFACRTTDWATAPKWWVDNALAQAAAECRIMSAWLYKETGFHVPPVLLSKQQVDDGRAGFCTHALLDPSRRHDPGNLPWSRFFALYKTDEPPIKQGPTVSKFDQPNDMSRAVQGAVNSVYPNRLEVDGFIGDVTVTAVRDMAKVIRDYKKISATKSRAVVAIENVKSALEGKASADQAIQALKAALDQVN